MEASEECEEVEKGNINAEWCLADETDTEQGMEREGFHRED